MNFSSNISHNLQIVEPALNFRNEFINVGNVMEIDPTYKLAKSMLGPQGQITYKA